MKVIQITKDEFVTYHIDENSVVASAYIGEMFLGKMKFNMKSEVKEYELDGFTIKQGIALHDHMKRAYVEEYGR